MMKKIGLLALLMTVVATSQADIIVKLPSGDSRSELTVEKGLISALAHQKRGETVSEIEKVPVKDGVAVIKNLPDGAAQYIVTTGDRQTAVVYAMPNETITINVTDTNPIAYTTEGSSLMNDITQMNDRVSTVLQAFRTEQQSASPDPAKLEQLENDFYNIFTNYIAKNPDSPAVAFAVMNLDSDKFMNAYNGMTPVAKESPLMPFVEAQRKYVEKALEAERRMAQLQSGNVDAPPFTFKDRNGKDVSLADFKGKWVIIDFWGSWCRWCIKGIPSLKEAYDRYKPELEIIGIACSDSKEAWLNALDKYQLPWVNVYNPVEGGGPLLQEYGVQGFPTKVIVSPEGKIKNITSGDNPGFYDILKQLMDK